MNIQTEKLDLIEWISRLNDTSIIDRLRKLKEDYSQSKDWWDTLKKEEIESISRGLKDFEEGRIHSHDTARKIYEKYL
jgi:predicted transcriptional regulator